MNEMKTQAQAQYEAPILVDMGSVNEMTETNVAVNSDGVTNS